MDPLYAALPPGNTPKPVRAAPAAMREAKDERGRAEFSLLSVLVLEIECLGAELPLQAALQVLLHRRRGLRRRGNEAQLVNVDRQ